MVDWRSIGRTGRWFVSLVLTAASLVGTAEATNRPAENSNSAIERVDAIRSAVLGTSALKQPLGTKSPSERIQTVQWWNDWWNNYWSDYWQNW